MWGGGGCEGKKITAIVASYPGIQVVRPFVGPGFEKENTIVAEMPWIEVV